MTPAPAPSATPPILEVHGLSRSFGGVRVIEKLDLAVAGGEIVGLLGPNGAGKSTLFNLIAGVLSPDAGSITYQTRDISHMKVWKRRRLGVGRTYQIPKPFTHMSVFENVLVGAVHGAGLSIRSAREATLDTLELTGLAGSMALPAGALSLLDLKRLELARAIASRPALLLLDEIAGGLTEGECDALLSILAQVHARGVTIVWVEHVLHALKRLATRLAVLYGGQIIAQGTPEAILSDPRVKEIYLGA
jgi:branched-chain amino acid transport system ATP-binding protein